MPIESIAAPVVASVNGVALNAPLETLSPEELRQYLQLLTGAAAIQGVELDAAATPLVQ